MKKQLTALALLLFATAGISAQTKFPGMTPAAKAKLDSARKSLQFVLPTWVPAGFEVARVDAKVGRRVKIENREFTVTYERKLASGSIQRFAIAAGFDGIGDLMYENPQVVRTPIGRLSLFYQPKDDDGKKIEDFAMTEWFDIAGTAFHYDSAFSTSADEVVEMISLADTMKILRSLKRY